MKTTRLALQPLVMPISPAVQGVLDRMIERLMEKGYSVVTFGAGGLLRISAVKVESEAEPVPALALAGVEGA